jgi:hypothetical protein
MEIDRVLDEEITEFACNLGLSPHSIYLGTQEWELFCKKAQDICSITIPNELQSDNIPEYRGIKVYKVNIRTHFGLGF